MSRVTRRRELTVARRRLIGVLVLGALIALLALAYVRPNPLAQELTVRAIFDDVAGMGVVGTEVRLAGTPVGKISDRRRVGDDALVTMQLAPEAGPIGRDASAELRPRTAFEGTTFVELRPGTTAGEKLGDKVIPRTRTRTFVALDEALRFATAGTRRTLREDVHDLGALLTGDGSAGVRETLRRAPALTRDLAFGARAARGPTGSELQGAVNGLADTVRAVAAEEQNLTRVVRAAAPTVAALDSDGGAPLDRTLRILPGALANLDSGGRALRALVHRVDVVSDDLRPGLRALAPALDETRPLLRSARPVLRQAPPFLREIRSALAAGGRAGRPADRLLRTLRPTAATLDSSLLPALEAPTGLGLPSYLQFTNLFQGGAGAFRPFLGKGSGLPLLDPGPGHFTRFSGRFFTGLGAPLPPCAGIGRINSLASQLLSRNGLCTP